MRYESPVFKQKKNKGRPWKYDFTPFINRKTEYVLIENADMDDYDSIRSTFCRWRKINQVSGRYEYDFVPQIEDSPKALIIWRVM
jgi:hypothetical protein